MGHKFGRLVCLVVVMITFSACSSATVPASPTPVPLTATPKPTSTLTLTPTASLTPTFIPNYGDIPAGKYLFVEYLQQDDAKENVAGACQSMAVDFPNYTYDGTTHKLKGFFNWKAEKTPESVRGFFGDGFFPTGKAGIGAFSELRPIEHLPYQYGKVTILGVNIEGRIAVDFAEHIVFLDVEHNTVNTVSSEQPAGCQHMLSDTLTNHGYLDKSQFDLTWPF